MVRFIGWFSVCLFMVACGGPRRLVIDNQSGEKATVIWGLRPKPRIDQPDTYLRVDTLYTPLATRGEERRTGLVFGSGTWNVNEYDRVTKRLAFVEVISVNDSVLLRLDQPEDIRAALEAHTKKTSRRVVRLVVK